MTITKKMEVVVEASENGYTTKVTTNNFTDYELIGMLETLKQQYVSAVVTGSSKQITEAKTQE